MNRKIAEQLSEGFISNQNQYYSNQSAITKKWDIDSSSVAVTIVFARRKAKLYEVFERIQEFDSA